MFKKNKFIKKILASLSIVFLLYSFVPSVNAATLVSNAISYSTLMKLMFDNNNNYVKSWYESHNFLKELYRDNTPSNFTVNLTKADFLNHFSNISINGTNVPFIDNNWLYISGKAKWSGTAGTEVFMDDIDPSVFWRKISDVSFISQWNWDGVNDNDSYTMQAIPLFTRYQSNYDTIAANQRIYAFILIPSGNLIIPDSAYPVQYRNPVQRGTYQLSRTCIKPTDSIQILSFCQKAPTSYYFSRQEDGTANINGSTISTTSYALWNYYIKAAGWTCTDQKNPELMFTVDPDACAAPVVPFTTYTPVSSGGGGGYTWGWWGWSGGGGWGGWSWTYYPPVSNGTIWFPTISLRIKLGAFDWEYNTTMVGDGGWVEGSYGAYLLQDKYKTSNGYTKLFSCYMKKTDVSNIYCGSLDFQKTPLSISEKAFSGSVSQLMNIKMAESTNWVAYFTLAGKRYIVDQDAATVDSMIQETSEFYFINSVSSGLLDWLDKKVTSLPTGFLFNKILTTSKQYLSSSWLTKLSIFENTSHVNFVNSL